MEVTRHQASQHLKTARQDMWRQYQGKTRNAEYFPGDLVWLHNLQHNPGHLPKLQSSREDRYKIVEVAPPGEWNLHLEWATPSVATVTVIVMMIAIVTLAMKVWLPRTTIV